MNIKKKKSGVARKCCPKTESTQVLEAKHCSACRSLAPSSETLPIRKTKANLLKGEYLVDKIVARRVRGRNVKYLVKWTDYPESCNTWEPAVYLFKCRHLIIEFEQALNADRKQKEGQVVRVNSSVKTRARARMELELQRGPYDIMGAGQYNGQVYFLVKWNRADLGADTVYATEANANWPLQVIRFYEERLEWHRKHDGHKMKWEDDKDEID